MYEYAYPRPAFSADVVALRDHGGVLELLLVERRHGPFEGAWALPGGFVDEWETPDAAARRELAEETGVSWEGTLTLVGVFGERGRDPRGWTVSCAYLAQLRGDESLAAGDDAAAARWFPAVALPPLAFDHHKIVAAALEIL